MTNIHTKKLFGGVETAAEVNARLGWRKPCSAPGCPNLPVVKITSFMPVKDFLERAPGSNPGLVAARAVNMTCGKMVRIATVLACKLHSRAAEVAAARAPSSVLVEVDRGPTKDRLVVGRAGGSSV